MFLFALLVIVAFVYTIRKTPEKLVNRDQTEEWKGWMQVSIITGADPGISERGGCTLPK